MSVICFHSSGITIFKIKEVKINDVENMTVPGKFFCIVLFTSKRRTWNEFLFTEMCDCIRPDLASRSLLLCPVWATVRRRWIP